MKRDFTKCRDCGQTFTECERCDTGHVCRCCPCECGRPDPSPEAVESMKRYDAAHAKETP